MGSVGCAVAGFSLLIPNYLPTCLLTVSGAVQAPLLCEVAAFVRSRHDLGPSVAESFASMAGMWASQYEEELRHLETQSHDEALSGRVDIQAKCALSHALVVITHGTSSQSISDRDSVSHLLSQKGQAARLAFHMVKACRYARHDCSPALKLRLEVAMKQCARVMACHVHSIDSWVQDAPDILSDAARGIFPELPRGSEWLPVDGALCCYVSKFQGSTYGINLLSGRALRNGHIPGQLPPEILEHPAYRRVFGHAMFEVTADTFGDSTVFRSARSFNGHVYSWTLQGDILTICESSVDPSSGKIVPEADLELLPCACQD